MGAYSRSHETGTRISDLHPESPAEPHVAVVGVADLVDAVGEHQRPLDAEAEREAAVPVGVDAAGDEHPGVDHAAAGDLDPALAAAHPAGVGTWLGRLAAADVALHGHVGGRLGEGEVVR